MLESHTHRNSDSNQINKRVQIINMFIKDLTQRVELILNTIMVTQTLLHTLIFSSLLKINLISELM